MPKFEVRITRTETYIHDFVIEADTAEAAAELVEDNVYDDNNPYEYALDKGYDSCEHDIKVRPASPPPSL